MGSVASNVLTVLLGWMRTAAAWLWGLLAGGQRSTVLNWLGANWVRLVMVLCVGGAVVDLVVYLLRWKPLTVWASFFRRLRHRTPPAPVEEQPPMETPEEWQFRFQQDMEALEQDAYLAASAAAPQEAPQSAPIAEEAESPARRRRADQHSGSILKRKATALLERVMEEEDPTPPSLVGYRPTSRREDTFQTPYIPQGWQKPERTGPTYRSRGKRAAQQEDRDESIADSISGSDEATARG